MIKSTKNQIAAFKLTKNRVIVKPLREEDELLLGNGNKLFLEAKVNREMHAPTNCTLVNICQELNDFQMPWKTTIEAKVGDTVICDYLAIVGCIEDANDTSRIFIDEDGERYFLIDYQNLFVAKRKGDIIPLNGSVICEPVEEEIISKIELPELMRNLRSEKFGKVAYLGSVNEEYYITDGHKTVRPDLKDSREVSVGDIIIFDKNCDLPLEYDLHQSLEGRNKTFYRMQRCNIKAIIQEKLLIQLGIS